MGSISHVRLPAGVAAVTPAGVSVPAALWPGRTTRYATLSDFARHPVAVGLQSGGRYSSDGRIASWNPALTGFRVVSAAPRPEPDVPNDPYANQPDLVDYNDPGPSDEPQVGNLIGNYMLVDVIASGGMGRVWRAVDREGQLVAMKTMLRDGYVYRKRLEREAQIGMIMDHPNLVKFIDCDLSHQWPYLVQELLVGVNLRDLYRARRRLPEQAVMYITYQLARALHQAYGFGIIHRDIKPDNCFLTSTGQIKLLDLGLAKVSGAERLTRPSDLVGTIQFMAPEQIIDASQVDCRVDTWSLGVMAFLFLTGQLPHKGKNVQEIQVSIRQGGASRPTRLHPDVSQLADRLVAKMTAVHPNHRHATPAHLLAELEAYFAHQNLDANSLDHRDLLTVLIPGSTEKAAEQARAAGAVPGARRSAAGAPVPAGLTTPDGQPVPGGTASGSHAIAPSGQPGSGQNQPAAQPGTPGAEAETDEDKKKMFGGTESYRDQEFPLGGLQFD